MILLCNSIKYELSLSNQPSFGKPTFYHNNIGELPCDTGAFHSLNKEPLSNKIDQHDR